MSAAIVAVFLVPCAAGAAAFLVRRRGQIVLGLVAGAATAATAGLLALHILRTGPQTYLVGGWPAPLGINLRCDGLSVLMLLLTAAVSLITTLYAALFFAGTRDEGRQGNLFWPLWLFLWGGLNSIFVSGDLFNIYLLLEFTLLSSVALASLGGSHAALISAFRYLIAATAAALFYVLGVTLLYSEYSTLDIRGLGAASPAGFLPLTALALLVGGLSLKSALFPLHFWLPPAHSTAPAPVSAVLSGLVVKAGFYVMMRVWLEVFPGAVPDAGGQLMAVLGATAILWGSWKALRQERLKMLIAYSTVAQMGYLFLLFPLAGAGDREIGSAAAYQMVSHGLAKAGMFLAAGVIHKSAGSDLLERTRGCFRRVPAAVLAIVVSGANLAGIAPAGGAKGKLFGIFLDAGLWWWAAVVGLGMLLAVAYAVAAVKNSFLPSPQDGSGRGLAPMGLLSLAMALLATASSFFSDAVLSLTSLRTGG